MPACTIMIISSFPMLTVGAEVDHGKMELLLSQLAGKDITEIIASGREKFASVPCGGGGVAVAAAAPAAGGGAAPQSEAKKEEKVEEKEESDDVRYIALCLSSWYPVDQHEFLRIACSSILFALYTAVVFLLGFLYTRSNHVMKLEWYILVPVFIYR